jgi:NAD(P)-dependent dehydrogenase (short-subunit alcohol dehydrogenase family)
MNTQLNGKVAAVTGAARGIGAAIARCLAAEGARLGLVDLDQGAAVEMAACLSNEALGVGADVSQESEAHAAIDAIVARFGRLDILVNNAGGGGPHAATSVGNPFTNVDQAGWDDALAVNLRTVFASSKAAIPHLKNAGGGAIVNIASIAGLIPSVFIPAYAAAKAGAIGLTRTLAAELGPHNIRVNAICPGYVWTRAWELMATGMAMLNPLYAGMEPREIFRAIVNEATLLGREQTPEDIGALAVFLGSDAAANITGQVIAVDGGVTLKHPGR